ISNPMRVETGRGVLTLDLKIIEGKVEFVTVNMGEPILEPAKVPFDVEKAVKGTRPNEYRISVAQGNELLDVVPVSTGNPHGVIFVADVAATELERIGPI